MWLLLKVCSWKRWSPVVALFILLLTSCQVAPSTRVTPDLKFEVEDNQAQPLLTTVSSPTVVNTETSFASPWHERCGEPKAVSPGEVSLPAEILAYSSAEELKLVVVKQDLTVADFDLSEINNSLLISDTHGITVSPDGKWIAYQYFAPSEVLNTTSTFLSIVSVDGNKRYEFPIKDGWVLPFSIWNDSSHLRVSEVVEDTSLNELLLSLQGEKVTPELSNLPGAFQSNERDFWVNSNLTFVMYHTEEAQWILWDLVHEQMVWQTPEEFAIGYYFLNGIAWAPDGTNLAFVGIPLEEKGTGKFEIFTLTINGELRRQTYFAEHFSNYELASLKWSLNGQILFFTFSDKSQDVEAPSRPLILEMPSGVVFDFCINTIQTAYELWSPDSSAVALIGNVADREGLLIVDITTGDIFLPSLAVYSTNGLRVTKILGWLNR